MQKRSLRKVANRRDKSVKWQKENSRLTSAHAQSRMLCVRTVLEYHPYKGDPEVRYLTFTTRICVLHSRVSCQSIKIMGTCVFVHARNLVYGGAAEGETQAHHLIARVVRDFNTELKAGKVKNAEDRRILWTNYWNISQWFDNWENDLVELGLAVHDPMSGKVTIIEDQLRNIINLDETALSLDGSTQNKGGRPEMILSDPRFPMVGRMTSKSSLSMMLICGSIS